MIRQPPTGAKAPAGGTLKKKGVSKGQQPAQGNLRKDAPVVLSLQQKSQEQKRSKKQKELDSIPDPVVDFANVREAMLDFFLQAGKIAFNARDKGEVLHWKDCAQLIKDEADREFGPTWHCVVGTEFGSFVTFEKNSVLFFHVGHMKVLLWKHG